MENEYARSFDKRKECAGRYVGRLLMASKRITRLDAAKATTLLYTKRGELWTDWFHRMYGEPWQIWAKRWKESQR